MVVGSRKADWRRAPRRRERPRADVSVCVCGLDLQRLVRFGSLPQGRISPVASCPCPATVRGSGPSGSSIDAAKMPAAASSCVGDIIDGSSRAYGGGESRGDGREWRRPRPRFSFLSWRRWRRRRCLFCVHLRLLVGGRSRRAEGEPVARGLAPLLCCVASALLLVFFP